MAEAKISPRARRIIEVGRLLGGPRWLTAMASTAGLSKQLLSFVTKGGRQVIDVYRIVAEGLIADGGAVTEGI